MRTPSLFVLALAAPALAACPSTRELPTDARIDAAPSAADAFAPFDPDAAVTDPGPVPRTQDLDLLFVIDNSSSMAEEQSSLIWELPRLVRVLATGDRDGDGVADTTPVRSLHVGFVTTDMGAGPNPGVPTCGRGLGDDGLLHRRSRATLPPCMASYPSGVFEFSADDDAEEFSATLTCVANIGTGGCGFEQQLEAPLKALSPISPTEWTLPGWSPPRFSSAEGVENAIAGNGQGPNEGFLRPDSALAVVIVTDEEDCSVRDYGLFVPGDPRYMSVPLNLRCPTFGDPALGIVHPISRYVDGFLGLRRDPRLLVFSVIAGIPPEVEAAAAAHDFASVLSHPDMQPRTNAMGTNVEPSCATANGLAFPPIRLVQVAGGLHARGARVSFSSICSASFQPAIDGLLANLGPVLSR